MKTIKQKMKNTLQIQNKLTKEQIQNDIFYKKYEETGITLYTVLNNQNYQQLFSKTPHSTIKLICDKNNKEKYYSCKIIHISDQELLYAVRNEYQNLKQLQDHPNILQIVEYLENEEQNEIRIIVENLKEFKPLSTMIQTLEENEIAIIFSQLFDALSFMHKKSITNRNVSPTNILVDSNYNIKLIDFTISKNSEQIIFICQFYLKSSSNEMKIMLTPLAKTIYSAPEQQLISDIGYTSKIDLWSSGVVLLEACMKQKPLKKTINLEKLEKSIENCIIQLNKVFEKDLIALLEGLLQIDQESRFSSIQALENPWISKYLKKSQR